MKAKLMTIEEFIKQVNKHTEGNQLQFSCFHDGMFVYEYSLDDTVMDWDMSALMLEVTFFPNEDPILVNAEHAEGLSEHIDFTKPISIATVTNFVDDIDISDLDA
jgi:hypothetical protein